MDLAGLDVTVMLWTFNGVPLHPLVVHAAVVFGPLAALGALAYLVPRWRDHLRWPLLVVAVIAFVSIWAAYFTGDNFRESQPFFADNPQLDEHEEYADVLRWVTTAFAVAAVVVTGWLHRRTGPARLVGGGVVAVLGIVTLVYVFLTGDAGAKAVYPPETYQDSSSAVVSTR